jgi:hypothetical protein
MWRNSLTKGRFLLVQRNRLLIRLDTRLIYWRTLSTVAEATKPSPKLTATDSITHEAAKLNTLTNDTSLNAIGMIG